MPLDRNMLVVCHLRWCHQIITIPIKSSPIHPYYVHMQAKLRMRSRRQRNKSHSFSITHMLTMLALLPIHGRGSNFTCSLLWSMTPMCHRHTHTQSKSKHQHLLLPIVFFFFQPTSHPHPPLNTNSMSVYVIWVDYRMNIVDNRLLPTSTHTTSTNAPRFTVIHIVSAVFPFFLRLFCCCPCCCENNTSNCMCV